jgi:hypothetical protein
MFLHFTWNHRIRNTNLQTISWFYSRVNVPFIVDVIRRLPIIFYHIRHQFRNLYYIYSLKSMRRTHLIALCIYFRTCLIMWSKAVWRSPYSDFVHTGRFGFEPRWGKRFFLLHTRSGRLWGPPSLLCNGYRGSFKRVKRVGAWHYPPTQHLCRGSVWVEQVNSTVCSFRCR